MPPWLLKIWQWPSVVVGGPVMALQGCPHPNPGTWEYVPLQGKRDFAEVMRLGILWWNGKVIMGYLGGPGVMTRVLINERRRQEHQSARKCDWWLQCEQMSKWCHEPGSAGGLSEKARNGFSPLASGRNAILLPSWFYLHFGHLTFRTVR